MEVWSKSVEVCETLCRSGIPAVTPQKYLTDHYLFKKLETLKKCNLQISFFKQRRHLKTTSKSGLQNCCF